MPRRLALGVVVLGVVVLALAATGCGGGPSEPPEFPAAGRAGTLPPAGAPEVGGVKLPPGRRVGHGLWRTDAPPEDPGRLWSRLAAAFPQTGLWPVMLETAELEPFHDERWERDAGGDDDPGAGVLRHLWVENVEGEGPFRTLGIGARERVTGAVDEARARMQRVEALALVPVRRPADAPAVMGWSGPVNWFDRAGYTVAVLRSWEERYDAILVGLGIDTMYLAVRRPARGEQARLAAMEIYAFCPDVVLQGTESLDALADELDGLRAWSLWWD